MPIQLPLGLGEHRSLKFKVTGNIEAAAIGAIDVLTPPTGRVTLEPSLEYRAALDLTAALGLAKDEESQNLPAAEVEDLDASLEFLAKLLEVNGTVNLAGTVRFAAALDITSPTEPSL